jgi:hypothetical protein
MEAMNPDTPKTVILISAIALGLALRERAATTGICAAAWSATWEPILFRHAFASCAAAR